MEAKEYCSRHRVSERLILAWTLRNEFTFHLMKPWTLSGIKSTRTRQLLLLLRAETYTNDPSQNNTRFKIMTFWLNSPAFQTPGDPGLRFLGSHDRRARWRFCFPAWQGQHRSSLSRSADFLTSGASQSRRSALFSPDYKYFVHFQLTLYAPLDSYEFPNLIWEHLFSIEFELEDY